MNRYKFTINGNQYEIDIVNLEENTAEVLVNGINYKVEVDKTIQATKTPKLVQSVVIPSTDSVPVLAKTSSPTSPKGGGKITSPLPGTIVSILVKVGDMVSIGQKLITLEAMKMENNINSDKEGKVSSIKVKTGQSVMEGDVLIVID